jgi:hypothetical protein
LSTEIQEAMDIPTRVARYIPPNLHFLLLVVIKVDGIYIKKTA